MRKENNQLLIVASLIIIMAILRVINTEAHIYNLIPIASLGLFSGSILQNKKWAYLIPLLSMFLSDIGIGLFTSMQGFYGISQIVNYGAIIIVTFMGTFLLHRTPLRIMSFTIGGSLIFFILSNLGTFMSGYYGYSFQSLIECYAMAIPFYKSEMANTFFLNSFAGDMIFSLLAFGIVYLYQLRNYKLVSA